MAKKEKLAEDAVNVSFRAADGYAGPFEFKAGQCVFFLFFFVFFFVFIFFSFFVFFLHCLIRDSCSDASRLVPITEALFGAVRCLLKSPMYVREAR